MVSLIGDYGCAMGRAFGESLREVVELDIKIAYEVGQKVVRDMDGPLELRFKSQFMEALIRELGIAVLGLGYGVEARVELGMLQRAIAEI